MIEYPKMLYLGEGWRKVASRTEEETARAEGYMPLGDKPEPEPKPEKQPERRKRHVPHNATDAAD